MFNNFTLIYTVYSQDCILSIKSTFANSMNKKGYLI